MHETRIHCDFMMKKITRGCKSCHNTFINSRLNLNEAKREELAGFNVRLQTVSCLPVKGFDVNNMANHTNPTIYSLTLHFFAPVKQTYVTNPIIITIKSRYVTAAHV